MTLQQPLFMQAGKYTAAQDRYLIGASVYPNGGTDQYPRPGVRPYATTSPTGDVTERSFRVSAPIGAGFNIGDVSIDEGACYVAGPASQVLNGVYLVINAGPAIFNVGVGGTGQRNVSLYVQIVDAEHGDGSDPTAASARFVTQEPGAAVPSNALLIANIPLTAEGNLSTPLVDQRTYTTMHGGTVLMQDASELTNGPMATLPMGSTAYALNQMAEYTRTLNGWETVSVLSVGNERPQDAKVPTGYQFFDLDTGTQETFIRTTSGSTTSANWYTMGRADGMVRRQTDADYAASKPRQMSVSKSAFSVSAVPVPENSGEFADIGSSVFQTEGPETKPSAAFYQLRFAVFSAKTLVYATVSAEIPVREVYGGAYETEAKFEVALDIQKYAAGGGATGGVARYLHNKLSAVHYAGMRFIADSDQMKSRTVIYELEPGEYYVYPLFRMIDWGNPAPGTRRIADFRMFTIEVAL